MIVDRVDRNLKDLRQALEMMARQDRRIQNACSIASTRTKTAP